MRSRSDGVTASAAQLDRHGTDSDKILVIGATSRLARKGHAELAVLDNGDIELRLTTGEVFLLGEQAVTRFT